MEKGEGNKLVILVKAPVPGRVKTRLARTIGAEAACEAYRRLVGVLLERVSTLGPVELRFAPDDAGGAFGGWLRAGWSLAPQGGGDLGDRMKAAFAEQFRDGSRRVVLIGSDCPALSAEDIEAAWSALEERDVVVGPAVDGGYWLIGLRANQPALFEDIAWSGPAVLSATLARARAEGLSVALLRTLTDVDTEEEWREFLGQ